jgi:hypothetical protein
VVEYLLCNHQALSLKPQSHQKQQKQQKNPEILTHGAMWMKLEDIITSEVSQLQKDK